MPRDIDTPGGEYVELQVVVNGNLVFKRDCVLSEVRRNGQRRYKVDDSDFFVTPSRAASSKEEYVEIAKRLLRARGQR